MPASLLRYPGGKQKFYEGSLRPLLPNREALAGRFVEPFVGGGAVFFLYDPPRALLADLNPELVELYQGIRDEPERVWELYAAFPTDREGYYATRDAPIPDERAARAARTLYLSRTCFKGQWRHNSRGEFNVGYGGQGRRKIVTWAGIAEASRRLACADLRVADFTDTIAAASTSDFLFIDPPYQPGQRDIPNDHYVMSRFTFEDHQRLAACLHAATARGVRWLMCSSSHRELLALWPGCATYPLRRRHLHRKEWSAAGGEVIITNAPPASLSERVGAAVGRSKL